jgi:hypothetical protein
MDQVETSVSHRKQSSHVRFGDEEYCKIEEDSINTGKSIPSLLKERYFSGPRPLPLFSKSDLEKLVTELGRIGNNMNQIARRVNSGIRAGFAGEFEDAQRSFNQLWLFLTSQYCRCGATNRA